MKSKANQKKEEHIVRIISVERPLRMKTTNISELGGKQISGCISSVYRREGVSKCCMCIDNYYAQTNNYGYSVLRDIGKQNPKTGEQTYIAPLDMLERSKKYWSWLRKKLYITTSKKIIWSLHRLLDISGSRRTGY